MRWFLIPALFLVAAFSPMTEIQELVDQDRLAEAYSLATSHAAAGDAEGHEALAWFHDRGKVVPVNKAEAARLFRKAAEAGRAHAQWRIGVMLDLGEGVAQDPVEALEWFTKSADQGYALALTSLAVMHAGGRGTPVDYAKARVFYDKAARAGDPHGFYGIGVLYKNGEGVERDPIESLAWMLVALALGDEQAAERVEAYGLSSSDTLTATARANQIAKAYGHDVAIEFRDRDAERRPVA